MSQTEQPGREIATLPPLDELPAEVPISEATGQPRRSKVMLGGVSLLYAAAAASAIAFAIAWWQAIHMATWPNATNFIAWLHPDPGTWQSVLLVCVMGALGAAMTAAPAISAFQAWNGHRWSRWAGVVTCGFLALAAALMNPQAWLGLPFAILGTLVLFLPPVTRYFEHWRLFREPIPAPPLRTAPVVYGPLERYQ